MINAAICHRCRCIVESIARDELVWCSCTSLAVDGGPEYRRRVGAAVRSSILEDRFTDLLTAEQLADARAIGGHEYLKAKGL